MAAPKYETPEYKAEAKRWADTIKAAGATCQQGLHADTSGTCLMGSRDIPAGSPRKAWHLGHNDEGTRVIGPTHARCNSADGGQRSAGTRLYWARL